MKTYKLNNIEVSEAELKKLIQDNPELLKKEENKYFTPGIDEKYFHICGNGDIDVRNYDGPLEKRYIAMGVYRTKEEAELAREKQLALVHMWNYADKNYYFRPDWNNEEQEKYHVFYNHSKRYFGVEVTYYSQYNFLLPFFKSYEDGEQFIKDNQKDLELFIK